MHVEPQNSLIYGIRAIEEALTAGRPLERVLLVQDVSIPAAKTLRPFAYGAQRPTIRRP